MFSRWDNPPKAPSHLQHQIKRASDFSMDFSSLQKLKNFLLRTLFFIPIESFNCLFVYSFIQDVSQHHKIGQA